METTFIASDIECEGCASSINRALGQHAGVQTVTVSVPTHTIVVVFDEKLTSENAIADELAEIGFPVKR